jgi:anaerobic ribonucleoside-triphosphate reductase activating protein
MKTNQRPILQIHPQTKSFSFVFTTTQPSTIPGGEAWPQVAGCSIRCAGCYVPETHEQKGGKPTSIDSIITEIDKKSGEQDGVSIIGGEPFEQTDPLALLVGKLKAKNYHLTVYSGYTLEELIARKNESVSQILANTDLLIDGAYKRELTAFAGEYRGSSNQRLIFNPGSR